MMPAIFRPSGEPARCFDEQEWDLLEPGGYVALLQGPGGTTLGHFQRAPDGEGPAGAAHPG